jgi:hypothetical protein
MMSPMNRPSAPDRWPGGRALRVASYFGEWPAEPVHASRLTACLRARGFDARSVQGIHAVDPSEPGAAPSRPQARRTPFDAGRTIARLTADLSAHPPDILHCWSAEANVIGALAGLRAAVPRIVLTLGAEGLAEGCAAERPELTLEWHRVLARQDRVRLLADRSAVAEAYSPLLNVPVDTINVIDSRYFRYLSRTQEADGQDGVDLLALLYYRVWSSPGPAVRQVVDTVRPTVADGEPTLLAGPGAPPARRHERFPTLPHRALRAAGGPVLIIGRATDEGTRDWLEAAAAVDRRIFVVDAALGRTSGPTDETGAGRSDDEYLAFCRRERTRLGRLVVQPWTLEDMQWTARPIGLLVFQTGRDLDPLREDFQRCLCWLSPSARVVVEGYDPSSPSSDAGRVFVEQELLRHGSWRWEQFESGRLVLRRVATATRPVLAHNHRSLEVAQGRMGRAGYGPAPTQPAA